MSIQCTKQFTIKVGDANLVKNPGFETGDFANWTQSGNVSDSSVSHTSCVHSGTYGASMGPSGSLGYLAQLLATTAGKSYKISCWCLFLGPFATPNEFQILWEGAVVQDHNDTLPTGWVQFTATVAATANGSEVKFGFRDDPAFVCFDDVSVTQL